MEKKTGIIMSDSPTQKVQGNVLPGFTKVKHSESMLSSAKTKNSADLVKFVGEQEVIVTYKLDGLTIVLMYDGGELKKAVTRGNGTEGEDVTEQIRCISGVPLKIPFTDKLVLRGECVLSWKDFERIKEDLTEQGKPCGHPRNIAAGSVRQLDTNAVIRELQYIAFSMNEGSDMEFGTKSEQMAFLNRNGFTTVHQLKCRYIPAAKKHTKTEMEHCIDGMKPEDCPYPVDGLIFEYDFVDYGRSLGGTSHHNNNMIAFKWSDETYTTTFRGIDYRATRTGVISMIIHISGFGQQAFNRLWSAIENSRHTTLNRVIAALGIPNIERRGIKNADMVYKN